MPPAVPTTGDTAAELLAAAAALNELFSDVMRRRGRLTLVQYRTLAALRDAPSREPSALARAVQVSSPYMTSVVDQLQQMGLVERQVAPTDRRRRQVVLTPLGRRRIRRLAPQVAELESRLLEASLDERERATLTELLRRLRAAITELAASATVETRRRSPS